jgi:hypothetical protein
MAKQLRKWRTNFGPFTQLEFHFSGNFIFPEELQQSNKEVDVTSFIRIVRFHISWWSGKRLHAFIYHRHCVLEIFS